MSPDELRKKIANRDGPKEKALLASLLETLERDWTGENVVTTWVDADVVGSARVADAVVRRLSSLGWRASAKFHDDQRDRREGGQALTGQSRESRA